MISLCLTLVLFTKVFAKVIETDVIIQPNSVLVVEIGASATLQCFISKDETEYIYWFKQSVGQKPHLVATSHKYSSEAMFYNNFNSTRLKVLADVGINNLIISETEPVDSAMYYCGVLKNYDMIFGEGTFLVIRGSNRKQFNGGKVVQQLVSDPVHPGDSVTLQCTVEGETYAGEHSVYWFRHGSGESLPGLIYTHGNRSDECDKSPEAGSPTHSCVYSLPKRNLSPSDAGTYYCAVVTCGDILFGNGTKLDIKGPTVHPIIPALGAALFLCVIVIVVLVCTRNAKKCCEYCTGAQIGAHVAQKAPNNAVQAEGSHDENQDVKMLHYSALDFAKKKPKKELERQITELKQYCVYSEVIATDWE